MKIDILCKICSGRFDSNDPFCKECEEYEKAFGKYGKTKSQMDYYVEALVESSICIAAQKKKN